MDNITKKHHNHHRCVFEKYGATSKGVDWGDEKEFLFRQRKMLEVLHYNSLSNNVIKHRPSLLDVGCGWGALYVVAEENGISIDYTGIDIVDEMIDYASKKYPKGKFIKADIFSWPEDVKKDFVVCNGVMTQKHADTSIIEMERYCRCLIKKMFNICRIGIAFNMMSNRVNFMVPNLYYQSPVELLEWLLSEVSPKVVIDHGYSSLGSGYGRLYDFTTYVYKRHCRMKIVISQPMYFPWIGLLEQVRLADIFVFYDDVQFVKGSFFNRVQVPTPWGIRWMTVLLKGVRLGQKINEVKVDNGRPWKRQHCELLKQAYRKAPFFNDMMGIVEDVFSVDSDLLVDFSMASTMSLVKYFDLDCGRKFLHSSSLDISGKGSERVLEIVVSLGGSVYITGHGAKNYLNHNLFEKRGIEVLYMDYACKEYPQLHGPFTPFVSALDLVANCGKEGRNMFISQTVNWRRFMS